MQTEPAYIAHPKTSPSPPQRGSGDRGLQTSDDEIVRPSDQAFDVLLAALAQSQAGFNRIQHIYSGEVMFESPGEPGTTKKSVYSDNSFSSNDLRQDARLNRTSLESRKTNTELKATVSSTSSSPDSEPASSNFAERSLTSQGRISAERFSSDMERNFQSDRRGGSGATSSNKDTVASEPLPNESSLTEQRSLAAPSAVSKTSAMSSSPTSNTAQQVAKVLATGQTQTSSVIRPTSGHATTTLAQETVNTRHAKSEGSGRAANYEDTARTVNARRTGAAAFDQLVQSIRMRAGAGRSTANLQLNPPELGRIVVNVEMQGDMVRIDVHTETSEAKQLLADRVAHLRDALQSVGVQVDQLSVDADVESMHDPHADSQDARANDEKPATTDRGSSSNRQAHDVSNAQLIGVAETSQDIHSVVMVAGKLDLKI